MSRKRTKAEPPLQITYGSTPIPEAANYKHLGIIQSLSGKYPHDIDTVKQTIRGTFLSLSQKVSGRSGTNPNTAIKLYKTAVVPKALFGFELWNSISNTDIQQLEVAHHFCLKRAKGLPNLTRSDMVLGLAGMTSIEAQIDLHKLAFLGSLCHAPTDEPLHKLFVLRLHQFDLCENRKIGFIPDILKILQKYNLENYLTIFKTHSVFPSKEKWKSVCKKSAHEHETRHWRMRLEEHNNFSLFKEVHKNLELATIWKVAKIRPDSLSRMKFLSLLCCKQPPIQPNLCSKCTHQHMRSEVVHALFECPLTDSPTRLQTFLKTIRPLSAPLFDYLQNAEPATLVMYLMGLIDDVIADLIPIELYPEFLTNCADFLQSVLAV